MEVTFDKYSLFIDGKREFILSGCFHYYRLPGKNLWEERLKEYKKAGLNTVDAYFPWHYHSPEEAVYDFEGIRDVDYFLKLIEENGLYLIARPGPYTCTEIDAGAFPGWLLSKEDVILRCKVGNKFEYCEEYLKYVRQWYEQIIPRLARCKNLILLQIENEYNFLMPQGGPVGLFIDLTRKSGFFDLPLQIQETYGFRYIYTRILPFFNKPKEGTGKNRYMKELYDMARELGIEVPIYHNDIISFMGRQEGVDIMAMDDYSMTGYKSNWRRRKMSFATLDILEKCLDRYNRENPVFTPELQAGWYDAWGGPGYDVRRKYFGTDQIDIASKSVLAQRATIMNYYMLVAGTTWGYMGSPDVYTSYDFAAPVNEAGVETERFEAIKRICQFVKTYKEELVQTDLDSTVSASPSSLLVKARKGKNKKFLFLRSLSRKEKEVKINVLEEKQNLKPTEMKVLVLDEKNNLLDSFGTEKVDFKREKPSFVLPDLKKWHFQMASPQIEKEYNDKDWAKIEPGEKMDLDSLGLHYGFVWYRGKYQGKMSKLKIDARHCYSIYVNGKLIGSYDNFYNYYGVGSDCAKTRKFNISQEIQSDAENIIVIVVESLGHHKDFEADARNPRGIVSIEPSVEVSWRYRGGLVPGEKGICPQVDFEKVEKVLPEKEVSLPHNWGEEEGVALYSTEFSFTSSSEESKLPPVGLVIDSTFSKANIYINGFLYGRYWQEKGPQKKFYLPWGILKFSEKNELNIVVWKRKEKGGLGAVYLELY